MLKYETPIMQLASFNIKDIITESWTDGTNGDSTVGDGDDLFNPRMSNIIKP